MNTWPENDPLNPQNSAPQVEGTAWSLYPDDTSLTGAADSSFTLAHESPATPAEQFSAPPQPIQDEPPPGLLFESFNQPEVLPPTRIPNFGHLLLLGGLTLVSLVIVALLTRSALHFQLFGISTVTQATTDIHYTLGSMAALYLFTFALSMLVFPFFWYKSLFAGLQWRASTAFQLRRRLVSAAVVCFVLALINGILMPGPQDTPIDKIFRAPGAAWLMFFFGITFAPFFEESVFRGFLLPALCTAYEWATEYVASEIEWRRPVLVVGSAVASTALAAFYEETYGHHTSIGRFLLLCFVAPVFGAAFFWVYQRYDALGAGIRVRTPDENGHPNWSVPAMAVGSLLTSIPFAWMHAEQIGHAAGPLLLLMCVSLVLCWARLSTRSLAASVLVHACYNFLLFAIMLVSTGGFRHLDKM